MTGPGELRTTLPAMDREARLAALRQLMAEDQLSAMWVTKPVNVRWISGFTGSNGQLLLSEDSAILFSDGRYRNQAAQEIDQAELSDQIEISIQPVGPEDGLAELKHSLWPLTRVGIESGHLSVDRLEKITTALPRSAIVNKPGIIDQMRQIKDAGERARLEAAANIADRALAQQLSDLVAGMSERDFAAQLDHKMLSLGSEGLSFDTIVASGSNSAKPHHQPTDRTFSDGDLVIIDFGAKIDGYGSDMTRTYVVGGHPTAEQADLYDAVESAQAAGVDAVRADVPLVDIDTTCRDVLTDRGYGDAFVHGTGHSLGLEIHEQPMLSSRSVGILRAGLMVTVEPGAYLPGFGGVRVEDSVLVTDEGCEPITHAPKGLMP